METMRVPKELIDALRDALDRDHPDNLRAASGYPIICAKIPASIWNRVRDAMEIVNVDNTLGRER